MGLAESKEPGRDRRYADSDGSSADDVRRPRRSPDGGTLSPNYWLLIVLTLSWIAIIATG